MPDVNAKAYILQVFQEGTVLSTSLTHQFPQYIHHFVLLLLLQVTASEAPWDHLLSMES